MIAADEVLSRVWGMLIGRERAPLAQIWPRRPTDQEASFFEWHAAPLGSNPNLGLDDLGEQQLSLP